MLELLAPLFALILYPSILLWIAYFIFSNKPVFHPDVFNRKKTPDSDAQWKKMVAGLAIGFELLCSLHVTTPLWSGLPGPLMGRLGAAVPPSP